MHKRDIIKIEPVGQDKASLVINGYTVPLKAVTVFSNTESEIDLDLVREEIKTMNAFLKATSKRKKDEMTLQETLQQDLREAIKNREDEKRDALKVVISELQRQASKILADDVVLRVLKKLEKSELELLEVMGDKEAMYVGTPFLKVLRTYIPQLATDAEIMEWIKENVDFSKFKNKMQAVGIVIKHVGATADGDRVKAIVQGMIMHS